MSQLWLNNHQYESIRPCAPFNVICILWFALSKSHNRPCVSVFDFFLISASRFRTVSIRLFIAIFGGCATTARSLSVEEFDSAV